MPRRKRGPAGEFESWSSHIHQLIDEMSNRMFFEFRSTRTWQPRLNLYATEHTLVVCLEIAGLDPRGVTLEGLAPDRIRLSGGRERPVHTECAKPFSVELMEIDEGRFERELELPDPVDVGRAEVHYERGFLWIILPRMESK